MTQEIYTNAREFSLSDVNAFICTSSDHLYISSFFHISGLKVGRGGMSNPFSSGLNIPLHNLRICLIFTFSLSVYMVFPLGYISVKSVPLNHNHKQKSHYPAFPPWLFISLLLVSHLSLLTIHNPHVPLHHSTPLLRRIPGCPIMWSSKSQAWLRALQVFIR